MNVIDGIYKIAAKRYSGKLGKLVYKICKLSANIVVLFLGTDSSESSACLDVVVCQTTFPARDRTVPITIKTLLRQSCRPEKIILWLSREQFPGGEADLPPRLLKLKEHGLVIAFCDELYSHKKYYYTMQQYPDKTVITVDDDMLYPETLIESLYRAYKENDSYIYCTLARRVETSRTGEKKLAPYLEWKYTAAGEAEPSSQIVPIGCGGVLYPPYSLDDEVFDKELFMELCPRMDDLWLKFMELKKGTKAVRVNNFPILMFDVLSTKRSGLFHANMLQGKNDESVERLCRQFPELAEKLMAET